MYATSKFFGALAKVPGYQRLPIYQAAQAVQRSADGQAYQQYQPLAAHMAVAFTGQDPHAVWCWYTPTISGTARLAAARLELAATFGTHFTRADRGSRADRAGRERPPRAGRWRPGWCRTRQQYRISDVRYAGYQWTAARRRARMGSGRVSGSARKRGVRLITCGPWGRKRS